MLSAGEIVPVVLDLRTGRDREPKVGEDLREFVHHLADRVDRALRDRGGRERHVEAFGGEAGVERGGLERGLLGGDGGGDALAQAVEAGAFDQALLGRHAAERLHQPGYAARLAERGDADGLERIGRGGSIDLREEVGLEGVGHAGVSRGKRRTNERGRGLPASSPRPKSCLEPKLQAATVIATGPVCTGAWTSRTAWTWAMMTRNAAGSFIARSAMTLRSSSMPASFMPCMKRP